jgi:hypothetical protein
VISVNLYHFKKLEEERTVRKQFVGDGEYKSGSESDEYWSGETDEVGSHDSIDEDRLFGNETVLSHEENESGDDSADDSEEDEDRQRKTRISPLAGLCSP